MENAKKFFEEVIKTEEAKKLFADYKKPETEEKVLEIYIEVAEKLGIELSDDEIKAFFAEKQVTGAIDDEELSQLSGGGENMHCIDTFRQQENCWWEDGCDWATNSYVGYICKNYFFVSD